MMSLKVLIKNILLAMLFLCTASLYSQVTLIPLFQNSEYLIFDNLFHVNIVNPTNNNIDGFLEISVEDRNTGNSIVKVNTPMITLMPGITNSQQINWGNSIEFGTNQLVNSLGSTGRFANGEYVFCYNFISRTGNQYLGVNCQEKPIRIAGVPSLISPYDKEIIDSKYPVLTWRPPLPSFNSNIVYSLRVAPYFKKQSKIEAITRNYAQVQLKSLNKTFEIYPASAMPLESGKKYVWQVKAYLNGFEIGATEIWEFECFEHSENRSSPEVESFRFVKSRMDASYYVANGSIYLAYDNKHNEKELNYLIKANDNSDLDIEDLPVVELENSINRIIINGASLTSLENLKRYTLVIKSKNRKKYYYNFVYLKE